MNRAPLIFLGIFFTVAFSWTGIVLTNHLGYADLQPVFDENEGKAFPQPLPGDAQRGKEVYRDLGCMYCHSQQVRHVGYGTDIQRGWGERGSVARDYIHERRVYLGTIRTGPDLRNVGARFAGEGGRNWHIQHFYNPAEISKITLDGKTYGSIMPPYRFLFRTQPIVGEPSPRAVQHLLPLKDQPPVGHEIVLTQRGEDLIAYLLALKDPALYPEESRRVYVPPAQPDRGEPAPGTAPASTTEVVQ